MKYREALASLDEEREILAGLETLALAPVRMHGVESKRTVAHFGWDYDYTGWSVSRGRPLPAFLEPVRARAAELADLAPEALEQVLVTRYPPGSGIGWHRDAPMFGTVVGVSLGSPCVLRFRRKLGDGYETRNLELAPRSAYVLEGPARREWQHGIRATPALRWSITFRTITTRESFGSPACRASRNHRHPPV